MSIGVFDSGVGGLSVFRAIAELLPGHNLVYLADQANVPYGPRPLDEIRALTTRCVQWLIGRGCDTVVIACNTASAAALEHLRQIFPDTCFVGMEPAVKPAAAATRTGVIGVLATEATLKAERFASLTARFASGLRVIEQACPDWVEIVERGEWTRAPGAIAQRLRPLLDANADTLVLGCTHFVFLLPQLRDFGAREAIATEDRAIALIDPSPAVARQAVRLVQQREGTLERIGTRAFITTGDAVRFSEQARTLLHLNDPTWTTKNSVESTRC